MDFRVSGFGVTDHVGETLLRNAEELGFQIFWKSIMQFGRVLDTDLCLVFDSTDHPLEGFVQAEVVKDNWSQKLREFSNIADCIVNECKTFWPSLVEVCCGRVLEHNAEPSQHLAELVVYLMRESSRDDLMFL